MSTFAQCLCGAGIVNAHGLHCGHVLLNKFLYWWGGWILKVAKCLKIMRMYIICSWVCLNGVYLDALFTLVGYSTFNDGFYPLCLSQQEIPRRFCLHVYIVFFSLLKVYYVLFFYIFCFPNRTNMLNYNQKP